MICKCLSKFHKAGERTCFSGGHLCQKDMPILWVQNIIHASEKEKRTEHYSCLTSHRNQHPQAPESFWEQVIYQGIVDSQDTSVQHRRGSKPRKSGKWLLSCLCLVTITTVLYDTRMPKGGMTAQPRQRQLSRAQGCVELKGSQRHLKPLNFTKKNRDIPVNKAPLLLQPDSFSFLK